MAVLRSLMKIAINHFGYDVRRIASPATIHIAPAGTDPISFEYVRTLRGYAVLEIASSDVRAFHALALPLRSDSHPFVKAAELARQQPSEGLSKARIENVLTEYYEKVRPASASEVLDLTYDHLPGLRDCPPSSDDHPIDPSFLPWGRSPAEVKEGQRRCAKYEGIQNGRIADVSDGVTGFGPVSPAKLSLEVSRLSRLIASVKSRGFVAFDPRNPLQVSAFRREGEYRWVIASGQHRFATAVAFGVEAMPAMVTDVVRREDARYWPQVVNGHFTEAGALSVFDRIFDGIPSSICNDWMRTASPD